MHPMLDPKRDLAGATPETLARALLRPMRPSTTREPVVCNDLPAEEVPADNDGQRSVRAHGAVPALRSEPFVR